MISTLNLTKYYDTHPAVREATLRVAAGDTCALVGPNGAGKTTLLKMLSGLLRPTSGQIEIGETQLGTTENGAARLQAMVGYVPDTFGLYDDLSVTHFLDYFARAQKVERAKVSSRIDAVLQLTNLESKRAAQVGSLSRGMRQRLVIAKTLLHAPPVLLLDEPASGLDPHARIELRELIKELARHGTTLIVSSHILTELADFCTSVIIMEQGRIVRAGAIAELIEEMSGGTPVRVEAFDAEAARMIKERLETEARIKNIVLNEATIDFSFTGDRAALVELHKNLVTNCAGVVSFYERHLTVEDIFMAVGSRRVA